MKNKAVFFLVMAVVLTFSLFGKAGLSHASTMPSLAWLRAVAAASPVAVALDREDNVYVADPVQNSVTVYLSSGAVVGEISGLAKPISVAVDANGRVYVGNDDTDKVMVFGPDLEFLFALGSGDGEIGKPTGIAVDDFGSVYVVDSDADIVNVYSSAGVLQFSFGGSGSTDGLFHSPMGVAVNEVTREVVVVDRQLIEAGGGLTEGGRAQIFDMNGGFKASFGEPSGDYLEVYDSNNPVGELKDQGMLAKPISVGVDSLGRIYVTDTFSNLVQVYDSAGTHLGYIQDLDNPLRTPVGLAVSRITGRLYVASLSGGVVDVFGSGVSYTVTATSGAGGVLTPSGVMSAEQGEKITFSVVPEPGYHLVQATVDGIVEGVDSQAFDLIVASDHAVAADFAIDTFSFTVPPNADGEVTFSGGELVPSGSAQTVTVTPRSGYQLVDLLVDGASVWDQVVDNSYTFATVTAAHTVEPVFAIDYDVALNIVKATNYIDGDVSTYPILAVDGEEVFTVTGGTSGVFNWFLFNAEGDLLWWQYESGNTFSVPVDELFANFGAGVYTAQVEDRNDPELDPATKHVRVPLRITPKFANHEDTGGSVAFAVTGASGDFTWSLLDEDGELLSSPSFGTLAGSSTATNTLTLTPGLAAVTSFQVQAQIADPVLAAAGLDTVISGPQGVMPMRQLVVQVDDGSSPLAGVAIAAVADQSWAAATGADGAALLPELADTGATYAFAVQKDGYLPVVVTTDDLSAPLAVSLDAIDSPAVISGSVTPAGSGTQVMLLRHDNTVVTDSRGNPVQVLADPSSGAYALPFDEFAAGSGPYRLAAIRSGFIYNLEENEGVVDAVSGESGLVIPLHEVTRLVVTDDGASPDVTFSITATPVFDGSIGEVQAFAGTSASAVDVTASLASADGGSVYTYTVPSPASGEAENIFVRGDTGAARSAASGYFASIGYEYLFGLNAPEETVIATPHRGSAALVTSASGNSGFALPAGGVSGDVLDSATLVMKEADPQAAGLGLISCSEIVDLSLTDSVSGEEIGNDAIRKAYVTVRFDPGKVAAGDFESGVVVICYAADIAGLQPGVATVVPASRIVKPINYGSGKVTFRVENLGAFGIGSARGGTGGLIGVDPAIRYIGSSRGWTDSGPDDFWEGK